MKTKHNIFLAGILFMTLITGLQAQHMESKQVSGWIESHDFVFKPQLMKPMRGPLRQLTPEYDLRVSKDSILSYLPFFGRAYTAPIDPSKSGIQFTSTDFEYNTTPNKKGGWDIVIQPKDYRDVQRMTLTVFEDGTAYLQVTSTSRESISFDGYITSRKPL